jgi:hypothetical protein
VSRAAHDERWRPKQRGVPVTHQRTRCSGGWTKSGGKDPLNSHATRERGGDGPGVAWRLPALGATERSAHARCNLAKQAASGSGSNLA